jgi:hypothetical protein
MTAETVVCQSCRAKVHGEIFHLGFSDMDALYCSSCPKVLLLRDWQLLSERGITRPSDAEFQEWNRHMLPFYEKVEALFLPCSCGGSYRYMNPPHCPSCHGLLRGDCYEDKPVLKQRDSYVFVSAGSIDDRNHLRSVGA